VKNLILFISTVVTIIGASFDALGASKDIDIIVSKGTAHITFSEYSGIETDLQPFSGSVAIEKAVILFQETKGSFSYVVVQLAGPTRLSGGGDYCGAGREGNFVWIKLSSGKVLDVMTVLYESCAFSIEPDNISVTKIGLTANYISYGENKKFLLKYDNKAPAAGFAISSIELSH
jgi:hypothetical protein